MFKLVGFNKKINEVFVNENFNIEDYRNFKYNQVPQFKLVGLNKKINEIFQVKTFNVEEYKNFKKSQVSPF